MLVEEWQLIFLVWDHVATVALEDRCTISVEGHATICLMAASENV